MLVEKASQDKLEPDELKELIKKAGKPPQGIPGLARATMALTVIVVPGIAIFHILAKGAPGEKPDYQ
jgi:hypothetical protein